MSLTSRLQALLTYANNKTGASDTTLGDAINTLVDGYGSGGGSSLEEITIQTSASGANKVANVFVALGKGVYIFKGTPVTNQAMYVTIGNYGSSITASETGMIRYKGTAWGNPCGLSCASDGYDCVVNAGDKYIKIEV